MVREEACSYKGGSFPRLSVRNEAPQAKRRPGAREAYHHVRHSSRNGHPPREWTIAEPFGCALSPRTRGTARHLGMAPICPSVRPHDRQHLCSILVASHPPSPWPSNWHEHTTNHGLFCDTHISRSILILPHKPTRTYSRAIDPLHA